MLGGFNPRRKTFWVDNMPGIQMSGKIKSKDNIWQLRFGESKRRVNNKQETIALWEGYDIEGI